MALGRWTSRTSSGRLTTATLILLVASVGLNVVQARRLGAFTGPVGPLPPPGSIAPRLMLKSLDGRPVEINFDEQPTILYYFSPNCGWCEKNWLNVKALVAATEGRYRFVGLSTTGDIGAFVQEHRLSFEVYSGMSLETARQYHFGATPHTVVVNGDGQVEFALAGAYFGKALRDVERALGITLPGVSAVPPAH